VITDPAQKPFTPTPITFFLPKQLNKN